VFDINGSEFILLLLVAVLVIGPARLPGYAEKLAGWVRTLRRFLRDAKARVDEELGDQAADVDWTAMDPRRYDPRRIVREALLDDPPPLVDPTARTYTSRARPPAAAPLAGTDAAATTAIGDGPADAEAGVPFDDEAT